MIMKQIQLSIRITHTHDVIPRKNVSFDPKTNEFFVVSVTARRKLMRLRLGRKWFIQDSQGDKRMPNRNIRSCSAAKNNVTKVGVKLSKN